MTRPETDVLDPATDQTKLLFFDEPSGATAAQQGRDLAAEKAARDRNLGKVAKVSDDPLEPLPPTRTTDKPAASLGLFLLRLVLAGVMGIHGFQHVTNLSGTADLISKTLIPSPGIMAIVLAVAELAIAVALIVGLLTRVAGLGITLITGGALAFVLWGVAKPFRAGQPGFVGETELLLAAAGLVLLFVGAGGWSLDARIRRNRARTRAGY